MFEHKVQSTESGGTGERKRILNEMAEKAWRLVSTAVFTGGAYRARVYCYFEHG